MEKEDKLFIIESSLKAIASCIPIIGGVGTSIWSDISADRKAQRLKVFLNDLDNELKKNTARINNDLVSKEDFVDVFEMTAKKIAVERSEEKREAFKNILLNGILTPNHTYDELENQIRILDQLNSDHIIVLKIFSSKKEVSGANTFHKFFKEILPGWEFDYIKDHLGDLENLRLIDNIIGNFQTMFTIVNFETVRSRLTSRGISFLYFILR